MPNNTSDTLKYAEFTNDELTLIQNALSNGFRFSEPTQSLSVKLQKEIAEELEQRIGIIHG